MRSILTPRQLAEAIGVSESSVKRWVDDGRIEAARTVGGHRRITRREATRYIRQSGATVVRPEALGLDSTATALHRQALGAESGEVLFEYLRAGAAAEARGWLIGAFLSGTSVAALVDGPLVQAMSRLGELWRAGDSGIFREHRATQIAIDALNALRLLVAPVPGAPAAVGGAVSGDRYILPSLAVAAVLEEHGWAATNLGPETPLAALALAVEEIGARLAWLSVSGIEDPAALQTEIEESLPGLVARGVHLVVGGSAAPKLGLRGEMLYVRRSMGDLELLLRDLDADPRAASRRL